MIALSDRAFVISFAELKRWSVNSLFESDWRWSPDVIQPLSAALERKAEPVDRKKHGFAELQLVTLHFDGEMEPRDLKGKADFKGSLFFADAGDVLYSKIDVRNGAIGIVPEGIGRVAVSSEYPVYQVRNDIALPEYIKLIFRSAHFRKTINSMISGASGRKRVQPGDLEKVDIPLPPLPVQSAIVAHWQQAREETSRIQERVRCFEQLLPLRVYEALGTPPPALGSAMPKWMVLTWKELERWSFGYLARARQGLLGFVLSRYPVVPLRECLESTANGYCIKPVSTPTQYKMLKLNALAPAGLDLSASKYVPVTEAIARRFSLRRGDLLICRSVGSYDQVAKCAIVVEDEPNMLFPDIVIRARFKEALLPEYAREVIQTPLGRAYFQSQARTAVGMWKIGAEDIRNFPMPLPPLDIQAEIVRSVQEARAEIGRERGRADAVLAAARAAVEGMILGIVPPPADETLTESYFREEIKP